MKWKFVGATVLAVLATILILPLLIQGRSDGLSHDCIAQDEITSLVTPAELYTSVPYCVAEGEYESAAYLIEFAIVFGRFDTYRVPDVTAHQVIPGLRFSVLSQVDAEKLSALQQAVDELNDDKGLMQTYCQRLKSVGKPDYHPEYMIHHGMAALMGEDKFATIDEDNVWIEVLSEYQKCA